MVSEGLVDNGRSTCTIMENDAGGRAGGGGGGGGRPSLVVVSGDEQREPMFWVDLVVHGCRLRLDYSGLGEEVWS